MSLRLRRLGYEVEVFDNNPKAGGRAQVYELGNFKFDGGPTVITAPFLFDELFALFGKKRSDYIEFLPVEPWYRFEFSDGSKLDYGGKMEDTIAEINRLSPGEGLAIKIWSISPRRFFQSDLKNLRINPSIGFKP